MQSEEQISEELSNSLVLSTNLSCGKSFIPDRLESSNPVSGNPPGTSFVEVLICARIFCGALASELYRRA